MPNPIKAVIWDLDGVILDSADEHRRAWQHLAREEGIPMTDADFWSTFGKRNDDIFATLWGNLTPEQVKVLSARKEQYFRELIQQSAQHRGSRRNTASLQSFPQVLFYESG